MLAYAALPWLLRTPEDFRERCKALTAQTVNPGGMIRVLAQHALDASAAQILSRTIRRLQQEQADLSGLQPVRVGLLSNGTMDLAAASIVAAGARHGLLIDVTLGGFGQFYQDALNPQSQVRIARPDVVVLALDRRAFEFSFASDGQADADARVHRALGLVDDMRRGLQGGGDTTIIMQTLSEPPADLFGNASGLIGGTETAMVRDFNRRLLEAVRANGLDVLLDVGHIASSIGLSNWHDATHWHSSKLPFSPDFIPLYSDHLARTLAAIRGVSRRCLVLDLDNTLWGGVIGDDGLEGIALGQGSGTGEAFLEVQKTALALYDRGVILAVCSKNDAEQARLPFRSHPEMILREANISAFEANWQDKPANLKAIAASLNIGLDALVFLDDNPAERALIRRELPMVAVPELQDDPATFSETLLAGGYFEAIRHTGSDQDRNRYYADNAKRAELLSRVADMNEYLLSLKMVIGFEPFTALNRGRVAQLVNKTNQFNLTTQRYGEVEIAAFETNPEVFTLAVRLRDAFGDNGLISAVICGKHSGHWTIDTWVMSCRVLQRKVEHAVLNRIVASARREGVTTIIGRYRGTPRNGIVQDLYKSLGFQPCAGEAGEERWRLDLEHAGPIDVPMTEGTNDDSTHGRAT